MMSCPSPTKKTRPDFGAPDKWNNTSPGYFAAAGTSKYDKCTAVLKGVWNPTTELCVIPIHHQRVEDEDAYDEGSVGTCRMGCAQHIAGYTTPEGKSCYTATAGAQTWDLSDACIGPKSAQINNFLYMCVGAGTMCPNSTCADHVIRATVPPSEVCAPECSKYRRGACLAEPHCRWDGACFPALPPPPPRQPARPTKPASGRTRRASPIWPMPSSAMPAAPPT